jgi:hypothetical protein
MRPPYMKLSVERQKAQELVAASSRRRNIPDPVLDVSIYA